MRTQHSGDKMSPEQIQAAKLTAAKENQRLWALVEKHGLEKVQASPAGKTFIEGLQANQFCRNLALTSAARGGRDPETTVAVFLTDQRGSRRLARFLTAAAEIYKTTSVAVAYPWSRVSVRQMFRGLSPEQKAKLNLGGVRLAGVDEMSIAGETPRSAIQELQEWAMYQPARTPRTGPTGEKPADLLLETELVAAGDEPEVDDLDLGGDGVVEEIEEVSAAAPAAPPAPADPLEAELGTVVAAAPATPPPAKPAGKRVTRVTKPVASSTPTAVPNADEAFMAGLISSANPVATAILTAVNAGRMTVADARARAAAINLKL